MLHAQKFQTMFYSMMPTKQLQKLAFNGFLAFALILFAVKPVSAEEAITSALLVPTYDNTILNDGFARWNQSQNYSQGYEIHASVLFDNLEKQNYDANKLRSNDSGRNDRTSNHLAVRYNITMKGYSVYDANDEVIKLWSFDKIDLNMNKKPELFFGVQKPFH